MVDRPRNLDRLRASIKNNPVTALLGPRQCGKTTLSRMLSKEYGEVTYFDLEDPVDLAKLSAPKVTLSRIDGIIIIDEIQRRPDLFPILRVFSDEVESKRRFLILGSASSALIRDASESLAGRIGFVDIGGFSVTEVGIHNHMKLWLRGGFPRSFLAEDEETSFHWRNDFIRAFLERDLPQLGITVPAETLRRFWTMIAHYHGQIWNAAEFARALGSSEVTARRYLDILTGAYIIRQLVPWYENIKKRQVKAQKIYIRDTGLLHALLSIGTELELTGHPKIGASWEGFVLEQIIALTGSRDIYFWSVYSGAELDILYFKKGKRFGIEIKYTDAPVITRSMRSTLEVLNLESISIIYPGSGSYPLDEKIRAVSILDLPSILEL
ncbi:MAG: ATP-binding protein [Spirochaetota bacterium]